KPGDLAFFRNDEGRITHVGIVVDDLVVHASGKVRMDYLDAKGIVNRESYRLTHQLHSLKRFL
ncbi:MAG TPA: hypothetical protein VFZ78_03605, partial [Flavisolibacter sp.]